MLQQEQPDDYMLASGVAHTVDSSPQTAFACVDLDAERYLRVDPSLVRGPERTPSVGDPAKAHVRLDWKPPCQLRAARRAHGARRPALAAGSGAGAWPVVEAVRATGPYDAALDWRLDDHRRRHRSGLRGPAAGGALRARTAATWSRSTSTQRKIEAIAAGESYIEDVSSQQLRSGRRAASTPTRDYARLAKADAVLICVPTPLTRQPRARPRRR